MGRRLILDTATLVAYENSAFDIAQLDDDDLAVPAVCVAEFRVGLEFAVTKKRAGKGAQVLEAVLASIPVLDYTERTAEHHALLLAHVRRAGTPRGAHDLIVAAHAAQTGRTIVTFDSRARFGDLPGVTAVVPA